MRSVLPAVHATKALFFAQKSPGQPRFRLSDFSLKLLPAHKFHSLKRLFEHPFLSTHASFGVHLWTFMQVGQRSGILRFAAKDSNTIVSVVSRLEPFVQGSGSGSGHREGAQQSRTPEG